MNITVLESPTGKIALVDQDGILIQNAQDMLDLIVTLRYEYNCDRVVVPKACVAEPFFDLETRIAGEALQKCINYQMKIAIVRDYSGYTSKALHDFIYESNKGKTTFFLPTVEAAIHALQ